jgi:thiol:disulfide interchange protein
VDLTSSGDPQSESLRKKYGALGVPTLVFLDSQGKELEGMRIIGFEPKEVMLAAMNRALQLNAERLNGAG